MGCGRYTPKTKPNLPLLLTGTPRPAPCRAVGTPPDPSPRGYLQEAAHLGSQGRELLGGRLRVELPAEQLGRQRRVAVVGGLRDAAEQGSQSFTALRARSQCLGLVGLVGLGLLGHVGGAAPAPRPAPLPALGWRLAAGARGGKRRLSPSWQGERELCGWGGARVFVRVSWSEPARSRARGSTHAVEEKVVGAVPLHGWVRDGVLQPSHRKQQAPTKSVPRNAAALEELYLTQMLRHTLPGNRTFDLPTQAVTHTSMDPSLSSLRYYTFTDVIITFAIITTIFPRPDNAMFQSYPWIKKKKSHPPEATTTEEWPTAVQ